MLTAWSIAAAFSVCPAVKYPSRRTRGGLDASGATAVCHFMLCSGMPAR